MCRGTLNEGRDVNPGDTAAVRRPLTGSITLNEGRDVNPGDTRSGTRPRHRLAPLNEGRDVNPGDTWLVGATPVGVARSTKAGT